MLTNSQYTPNQLHERYQINLFGLMATAWRMKNRRVIVALQELIDRAAMRGLRLN